MIPGDSDSSIPSSSTVTLVLDSSIQPALGHPPQCGCIQCHYCHDMRFAVGHASNVVYNSTPATVHYPTGQSAAASEPVAPAVTASQPITPPISPRQLIAQLIVANKAIVQPVDEPIPSTTQAPTNFQILPPSIIRPSSLPNQLTCSAQDPVSLLTTIGPTVPLRIETRFRLFNGGTGVTRWHKSVSDYTLDAPHPVTNAEVGDVYVHVNIKNGALQVWVREENGSWEAGDKGHQHPTIANRRLSLRGALPSWVLHQSLLCYEGRERKKEFEVLRMPRN